MVRRQACLIVPDALRADANTLAALMGYDDADPPDTYNIPLVAVGETAPTHWATITPVTPGFEAMILQGKQGTYTIASAVLVSRGLNEAAIAAALASTVAPVIAGLIADFVDMDSESASAQLERVAAEELLERWVAPDPG